MATNTSTNPTPEADLNTNFMTAIQEKLLGQSGVISSTNSQLETRLNAAISGVQTSATKANEALKLDYGRQVGYTQDKFMQDQVAGRAAGSGGIVNMAAYTALKDETNKNLKDLEDRKQSLILQNDSQAAAKVAELQFQALDFQQKAQQQTFSNLLGMANLGIQSQSEARLAKAQTFTENKAMSDIALQYGLKLSPGDTLDSITSKAMVFASEEQKARLAKLKSETAKNNADAAKILAGTKADANAVKITPEVTSKLAARWKELEDKGFNVNTSAEMENILGKYAKAGKEAEFYDAIATAASESAKAQFEAAKAKESPQGTSWTEKGLPGASAKFGAGLLNSASAFSEFLLGQDKGTFPRY